MLTLLHGQPDDDRDIRIPKLVNGRGTLPIDIQLGRVGTVDVGRLRVPSGTTDPDTYRRYVGMLRALASPDLDRGDLLLAIRDREKTCEEVHRLYKAHKLNKLPRIVRSEQLETALFAWLDRGVKRDGHPFSPETLAGYRNNFTQLLKHADATDTVKDLPTVLQRYREWCVNPARFYTTPFRQTKNACLAFVRATEKEKQYSDLYRLVALVDSVTDKRKRERNAISLWEVREIMKGLPEFWASHVWTLALTGMRFPSEYSRDWRVSDDRILLVGRKTENAARFVPRIDPMIRKLPCGESRFRQILRPVTNGEVTPYDLRATYRRLLTLAVQRRMIEDARAKFYFGHSRNLQDNYETHAYDLYVRDDAQALQEIVKEQVKAKPKPSEWDKVQEIDWDG